MIDFVRGLLDRCYTERVEDVCTRILYFHNTLDTYFVLAAVLSLVLVGGPVAPWWLALPALVAIYALCKAADFYPAFLLFTPLFALLFPLVARFDAGLCAALLGANVVVFVVIQVLFMGIPDSIVARDPTIPLRKLWHSLFTIAPTTVSASISLYFATLTALVTATAPNPFTDAAALLLWVALATAALVARRRKPASFRSPTALPVAAEPVVDRVILLNIDGCRLDRFRAARLPLEAALRERGTWIAPGAVTVYRALTNPAFVSILTGTTPEMHGVRDNNLGYRIAVEGLPDIVPTILYGSMHVKHFSKPHWPTRIVSLPRHSVYRSDDLMLAELKDDLVNRPDVRLFVADLSEVDFLGHAYGSTSRQYDAAIGRAGERITAFLAWLAAHDTQRTAVVISSDHGMVAIDHSYLLFDAEKYVPLFFLGHGIRANQALPFHVSIMDITPTISYLLGVRHPAQCIGRVLTEVVAPASADCTDDADEPMVALRRSASSA